MCIILHLQPGALNEFMFKFDKPVLTVLNTFVDEQYNVRESEGKATLKQGKRSVYHLILCAL